jgi:hypothetical protein
MLRYPVWGRDILTSTSSGNVQARNKAMGRRTLPVGDPRDQRAEAYRDQNQ